MRPFGNFVLVGSALWNRSLRKKTDLKAVFDMREGLNLISFECLIGWWGLHIRLGLVVNMPF